MTSPYPGWPPSQRVVSTVGGLTRTCFVIELRSLGQLSPAQVAIIQERLEAGLATIKSRIPIVEDCDIVSNDRFDTLLRVGLRVS